VSKRYYIIKTEMNYKPAEYWDKRLSQKFNLQGVGYCAFNKYYNFWLYKAKTRALKNIVKKYNIGIYDKTLLDIGCGTGYWVNFYKILKCNVTGIDISKTSVVNLKRRYPKFEFINIDFALPNVSEIINKKFDIINAFDVFYHIVDDNSFQQALENICLLSNNSTYIFITDLFIYHSEQVADHVKFRSFDSYEKIFNRFDIKVLTIEPLYFLLNKLIFSSLGINKFANIGIKIDEFFSPVYYFIDSVLRKVCKGNLNLLVAKK
jgi:cyclopropane fatty-acyl-phospholipid synthase-like methyltransferase